MRGHKREIKMLTGLALLLCPLSAFSANTVQAEAPAFGATDKVVITDTACGLVPCVKTSAKAISVDGTLAGNSDSNVSTEKAVKTYVDTQLSSFSSVDIVDAVHQSNLLILFVGGFLFAVVATREVKP
jgi:hypothetical protein